MASAAMIVVGLVSAMALAQPEAGVRLDYQADARCTSDEKAFIAEVHARSPRIRISPDASRSLVVRIVRVSPSKMAGRIELHEPDGTKTERAVSGASCEEIVSALGLVTALALDPTASTSTSATTDAGSPQVVATVATASSAPDTRTTDAGVVQRHDDDDEQAKPLAERRWSFGAGADGEVVMGVSPDPLFAVPVFFEATRAVSEHVGLGAGIRFERTGETSLVSGSGADFTFTVGALDLCVLLRTGRVRFNTCVRSHAGVIDAHGEGVAMTRSATRPWVDVGVALALRLRIAGPVFVEAQGGVGVPLVQDRFFLEPNDTVFQASFLTGHAGGGLGFEIW
jgi:hypothetical protein